MNSYLLNTMEGEMVCKCVARQINSVVSEMTNQKCYILSNIPNFLTEKQQLAQSTKTDTEKEKKIFYPGLFRVKSSLIRMTNVNLIHVTQDEEK